MDYILWIRDLIAANRLHDFYTSSIWLKLRAEVLESDRHECQRCKKRGFYKRADTVHHEQYVKKYPELALSKTYIYNGEERRNLTSLCHTCHEGVHDYRRMKKQKPLTEERW